MTSKVERIIIADHARLPNRFTCRFFGRLAAVQVGL
jgi:hypothetical protein